MAKLLAATTVVTNPVRLSYAKIHEPVAGMDGGAPKYSVALLIPKEDKETLALISQAINAAKEIGKEKKWGGKLPNFAHPTVNDGDKPKNDGSDRGPECKGMYIINAGASMDKKPVLLDLSNEPLKDVSLMVSGSWALAKLNFYPYANKSFGVSAGLNGLRLVNAKARGLDDSPLSGGGATASDFADEAEDKAADDMSF